MQAPFCEKHKNHWSMRRGLIWLPGIALAITFFFSGFQYLGHRVESKRSTAKIQLKLLNDGVDSFTILHGRPPVDVNELFVDVDGKKFVLKNREILIDPWGKPLVFDGTEFHCESLKDQPPDPFTWDYNAVADAVSKSCVVLAFVWVIFAINVWNTTIRATEIAAKSITLTNIAPEFGRAFENLIYGDRPEDGARKRRGTVPVVHRNSDNEGIQSLLEN